MITDTTWECAGLTSTGDPLQRGDPTHVKFAVSKNGGPDPFPAAINYSIPGIRGTTSAARTSISGNTAFYEFDIGANILNEAKSYQVIWKDPDNNDCPGGINVWNIPYFKATNGAIRTGGNFLSTGGADGAARH